MTNATKRRCRHEGCITILRSTRKGNYCSAHEDPRTEIPIGPRGPIRKRGEFGEEGQAVMRILSRGPMTTLQIRDSLGGGDDDLMRVRGLVYRLHKAGHLAIAGKSTRPDGAKGMKNVNVYALAERGAA